MQYLKKIVAFCLCAILLFSCAMAEETTFQAPELTPEELAQWAEWSGEGSEVSDATAENAVELTPEEEAMLAEVATMLDDSTMDTEVDMSNLELNEKLPDHVVNILLLGVDNRTTELVTGRADANIICSINKQTGAVTLSSIARDTAVEVPGYKSRKRMNTAFKFGSKDGDIAKGAELAMKTVNRNFQMNIQYYVVVNIHGLADIISAIGGLDMELTKAEASAINYELFTKEPMDSNKGRVKLELKDGVQHLDGMQAVTYGRIRNLKGQNDINRNGRQRVLLETMLAKVLQDMDLIKLMTLIETALPYGYTNLTIDELLTLGLSVLSGSAVQNLAAGGEVVQQFGIPMEKEYGYREFEGNSLIYISERRMNTTLTALQTLIYGETFLDEQ